MTFASVMFWVLAKRSKSPPASMVAPDSTIALASASATAIATPRYNPIAVISALAIAWVSTVTWLSATIVGAGADGDVRVGLGDHARAERGDPRHVQRPAGQQRCLEPKLRLPA